MRLPRRSERLEGFRGGVKSTKRLRARFLALLRRIRSPATKSAPNAL